MLADVGICWLQEASSWLQDGSRSLYVGSSWLQDAKNGLKMIEICSKIIKIDVFQATEKPKYIGKLKSGSKSRKNDHEAKTYQFGSHLGAILASSWGTWETFGGHFRHLGSNLSQHKAILSHLGANLKPLGANISQHEPTWSPRNHSGCL